MSTEIPLTQGKAALVDEEDLPLLEPYTWRAMKTGKHWYAITQKGPRGACETILMHRLLLGLRKGDKRRVDHINRNGLDNRRENIRVCSHAENLRYKPAPKRGSSSQYKGVYWDNDRNLWASAIVTSGDLTFLGRFEDEKEAAQAYDEAALEQHGEFAWINFPTEESLQC